MAYNPTKFSGRTPGQGESEIERGSGTEYWYRDKADKTRIENYLSNEELLSVDEHYGEFQDLGPSVSPPEEAFWIAVDFFGMLGRLMRHYVFGGGFAITGRSGAANDVAVRRIFDANNMKQLFNQAAEQATALGDVIFRVDIEDREDEEDPEVTRPQAVIRAIHPCHYFPELDELDSTKVKSVTLAWVFGADAEFKTKVSIASDAVVLLEKHEPGEESGDSTTITYELWEWDGTDVGKSLDVTSMFPDLEDGESGINEIPIIHMGNEVRSGEFWGRSEFDRIRRIILAIESRLSQEDEVLDKHARPKLIVGPGVLNPNARASLADFDVIEIEPSILEKAVKPEYLTWDMKIDAIKHEIEKLEEYLFITTETSPASFGLERDGSQVESARALRFKAHRTVNKVDDKRIGFEQPIRDLFRVAQKLEIAALDEDGETAYQRGPILFTWPDPIIEDQQAETEQYVSRKQAGLISRLRAVRDLDNLTETEAQAEVQEILQDQVDESAAATPALPALPPGAEAPLSGPVIPEAASTAPITPAPEA